MSKKYSHNTVLLNEAVEVLNIRKNGIYIDCTFGYGGHSRLILSKLNAQGILFAIDRDPDTIKIAHDINDPRFIMIHGSFSYIENYMIERNLLGRIDGILLDLGISSMQLDDPNRGFSFIHDGPLDMRMNNTQGQSASEWLMQASEDTISFVIKIFGEERFHRRIAKSIMHHRNKSPITRTTELATLIAMTTPYHNKYKHPATRTFQAIRIYINRELEELKKLLNSILNVLAPGGILSVISFHSLEDRLVKQFIRKHSTKTKIPLNLPLTELQIATYYPDQRKLKNIGKIRPSPQEISNNKRARSAILRFAEKY